MTFPASTPDYDFPAHGRAHIRGWGEEGPLVVEGKRCDYCGHTGGHQFIVLGIEETIAISVPTLRDLGALRRAVQSTEVRP